MSRRRTAVLTAVLLPVGMALAALVAAAPAAAGDHVSALRMPLIGSGTHPVVPVEPAVTVDSWGVGNG